MRIRAGEPFGKEARQTNAGSSSRLGIVIAMLVLFLVVSAACFVAGMAFFRSLQPTKSAEITTIALREVPSKLRDSLRNHVAAARRPDTLERIHLDIKFKPLEKLRAKRAEAIPARHADFLGRRLRARDDSARRPIDSHRGAAQGRSARPSLWGQMVPPDPRQEGRPALRHASLLDPGAERARSPGRADLSRPPPPRGRPDAPVPIRRGLGEREGYRRDGDRGAFLEGAARVTAAQGRCDPEIPTRASSG